MEKLLDKETLNSNLLRASLYLTAFELLEDALVGSLEGFFSLGPTNPHFKEDYETKVLALYNGKKHTKINASALWFQQAGAMNNEDLKILREIIDHRNQITHELPRLLTTEGAEIDIQKLLKIRDLIVKLDRWCLKNLEMSISLDPNYPDLDMNSVAEEEIYSGRMVVLDYIIKTVFLDQNNAESKI